MLTINDRAIGRARLTKQKSLIGRYLVPKAVDITNFRPKFRDTGSHRV